MGCFRLFWWQKNGTFVSLRHLTQLLIRCRCAAVWFPLRSFTGVRFPYSKVAWRYGKRRFTVIQVRSAVRTKVDLEPA